MSIRTRLVGRLFASLALNVLVLGAKALAQGPATLVIVIDDTQVRAGDGPRVAALIDRVEREVLNTRATFGIATVGPAGLIVDLTREPRRLREASDAARAGRLDFTLPPNPKMAAAALLSTMQGMIDGLAKRSGPKAVTVIGRASPLAAERRTEWLALRRHADAGAIALAWFDLDRQNCPTSKPHTDAAVLVKVAMCASVSDAAAGKVLDGLADLVRR